MTKLRQSYLDEPFFITEEVEAEIVATGYGVAPPPIACMGRLALDSKKPSKI